MGILKNSQTLETHILDKLRQFFNIFVRFALALLLLGGCWGTKTVDELQEALAPTGATKWIELPDGTFPEGIAVGRGSTFYVGSLSDAGRPDASGSTQMTP